MAYSLTPALLAGATDQPPPPISPLFCPSCFLLPPAGGSKSSCPGPAPHLSSFSHPSNQINFSAAAVRLFSIYYFQLQCCLVPLFAHNHSKNLTSRAGGRGRTRCKVAFLFPNWATAISGWKTCFYLKMMRDLLGPQAAFGPLGWVWPWRLAPAATTADRPGSKGPSPAPSLFVFLVCLTTFAEFVCGSSASLPKL
jgi:hypothetical protein